MEPTAETHIRKSSSSAREARRWLAKREPDLSATTRDLLVLMLSELVSNSVVHGGLRDTDHIAVRVRWRGNLIRVEVHDPGGGFVHADASQPVAGLPEDSPEHGYGLMLVDTLATAWGIDESRPTTVWFELETKSVS